MKERSVQRLEAVLAWALIVSSGWRYVTADVPDWAAALVGFAVGAIVLHRHRREDRLRRERQADAALIEWLRQVEADDALLEHLRQAEARGRARVDWFRGGGS